MTVAARLTSSKEGHPARVLVAILLGIWLAGLAWGALMDWRALSSEARLRASDLALSSGQEAGRRLREARDALRRADQVLSQGWQGSGPVPPDVAARLANLPAPAGEAVTVVVIAADGRLAYSREPAPLGADLSRSQLFIQARAGTQDIVLPAAKGSITGVVVVRVGRALVAPNGEFRGVVALGLPPAALSHPHALAEDVEVLLVDDDGGLVAGLQGAPAIFTGTVAGWVGGGHATFSAPSPVDGSERVWGRARLAALPLAVYAGISTGNLKREWLVRQRTLVVAFLPLVGLVLVLTRRSLVVARREKAASSTLATALAEREMLLSEVHHRVKNNLQIIQSLLTMEILNTPQDCRRGYEDSANRLQAMGMIHELLYSTGQFGTIAVKSYLVRLCELLVAQREGISLTVEGEEASLDLDRAVPFAMALNEIVSNAVKHGFPDGRTGTVTVRIARAGEWLEVAVADDGVGLPDGFDPASGNMGMRLVAGLASQLGGTVTYGGTLGATVSLRFPA